MNRRDGQTAKRAGTQDPDQTGNRSFGYDRQREQRRNPFRKLIPFLFIAVIGLLIAREEIPAVHDWWQKTFSPDSWRAQNACRQAVIDDSGNGKYLRVLKPGEVHNTIDGPYVENLLVVELGANGVEEKVKYTCYLDKQGMLFKLNRRSSGNRTGSDTGGD
jgi:hypothetical protein